MIARDDNLLQILPIAIDVSLIAKQIAGLRKTLVEVRGAPRLIRMKYGPHLISVVVSIWCAAKRMGFEYNKLNKRTRTILLNNSMEPIRIRPSILNDTNLSMKFAV